MLGSYLVISLTNVIPDLEFLDDVGWYYIYLIGTVAAINFIVVITLTSWNILKGIFPKAAPYIKKV